MKKNCHGKLSSQGSSYRNFKHNSRLKKSLHDAYTKDGQREFSQYRKLKFKRQRLK